MIDTTTLPKALQAFSHLYDVNLFRNLDIWQLTHHNNTTELTLDIKKLLYRFNKLKVKLQLREAVLNQLLIKCVVNTDNTTLHFFNKEHIECDTNNIDPHCYITMLPITQSGLLGELFSHITVEKLTAISEAYLLDNLITTTKNLTIQLTPLKPTTILITPILIRTQSLINYLAEWLLHPSWSCEIWTKDELPGLPLFDTTDFCLSFGANQMLQIGTQATNVTLGKFNFTDVSNPVWETETRITNPNNPLQVDLKTIMRAVGATKAIVNRNLIAQQLAEVQEFWTTLDENSFRSQYNKYCETKWTVR